MRINTKFLALFFGVLGLVVIVATQRFPKYPGSTVVGPAMYPRIIGLGFIVGAIVMFFGALGARTQSAAPALDPEFSDWDNVVNFLAVPLAIVVYLLASDFFGFIPTASVVLFVLLLRFGVGLGRSVMLAAALVAVTHAVFYSLLSVPLPWGLLEPLAW